MTEQAAIRNVSFVGHPSSGKTTLIDALAHRFGASERKGSVADKTSICDTEPEEQEKQHSLQSKVVHAEYNGHAWNLFDTPGYPDFIADTIAAMAATDLVVGVVSCQSGVTFNLRNKMRRAGELGRGRAIILTHLDGENASFEDTVAALREGIGEICVPFHLPDQSGPGFSSIKPVFDDNDTDWKKRLQDRAMDACEDEEVVMNYLESEELSDEQLHENIPNAVRAGALIPILICNPNSEVGLDETITFLDEYAPTAATGAVYETEGEPISDDGPPLGVVVSVRSDPHVGRICAARILRGSFSASDPIAPDAEGKGEKMGGLFHLVGGKKRDSIETATAGDIVAFTKVEHVGYGQTFSVAGQDSPPVDMPRVPEPTVSVSVTPKSRADEQKIGEALHKLTAEDPTFRVEQVALTHELVATGMSDLHLQIMESRLKRRYGVEIETALPRIAYRETITKPAEGHHRHKKQSGGRGQFGECYIRVKPGEQDSGIVFVDKVVGGAIPRNLIPAVEKGIKECAARGVLTSSVVVDVEVELYDGKFHAVDSDEASFKMAGDRAFRDAFGKAGPVLLEPVMLAEIHLPSSDAGTVFSDITSQRRGHVIDQESDGAITIVKAHVPLATMQTYFRDLKSQTSGEGTYSMTLDHYAAVPANEQQKVVAAMGQKAEED